MSTIRRESHSPSIWAFILIALGVIWLLFEAHVITGANLVVLFRLWPVVLIAFGLELLLGRGSRSLSLLIGLGTVVLLLALMVVGPSIGLSTNAEIKHAQFSEPVEDATAAQMDIDLSVGHAIVQAGAAGTLIDADLDYVGDVTFDVSGSGSEKFVSLTTQNDSVQWFDFLGLSLSNTFSANEVVWNVSLTPDIPLDLRLNGGVGGSDIDLSGVQLSRLDYNSGVGDTTVILPGSGSYSVDLNGGVGDTVVRFADGATVNASIDGGVGNLVLDVPDNAAVRVEGSGGLGNINLPSGFNRISGEDSGLDRNGVWESDAYASADDSARITILFNGGVGGLTVQ